MEAAKCCARCHELFALAEERVENKYGTFHVHCDKERERRHRLREFLIRHAIENGTPLKVVPRRLERG